MSDQEVPEPDAFEQGLPVTETAAFERRTDDPEAPEADALEQAREELPDDDGPR